MAECTGQVFANPINYTCDILCPDGYFAQSNPNKCDTGCLPGTFADPYSRLCATSCPVYPMLFANSDTNKCEPICSTGFAFTETRTCLPSCPNASGLIYLADQSNTMCVLKCVHEVVSYADYANN